MAKVCTIILVRHGESVHNKQGIIAGDSPLTDKGRDQARQTKQALGDAGFKFDDVYSSDRIRAIETAEIIAGKEVPASHQLASLRERDYGRLDSKSTKHQDEEHAKRVTMTPEENWVYKHVPDIENDRELSTRFVGALRELAEKHAGQTILVGAHGAAIRVSLMKLLGLTYYELPQNSFKNAGYVELKYADHNFEVVQATGVRI
jgi:broad specificity phosphatase PhoE